MYGFNFLIGQNFINQLFLSFLAID